MARFYDSLDISELARVEHLLRLGGVEYTIHEVAADSSIKEIDVAEEDLVFAEALLSESGRRSGTR